MSDTNAEQARVVTRVYGDGAEATRAIVALRDAGVPTEAISVLSCSTSEAEAIEDATGASDDLEDVAIRRHPLRDIVDWLGRVESVVVPGFGAVLGTGDLWQDVARGGGRRGGITGALVGLGIPVDEAAGYERSLAGGDILVAVHDTDLSLSNDDIAVLLEPAAESD
jgi:hypothetical protein